MIQIGDKYFQVKIIRKRNHNIYLRVKGDILEVTCPYFVSKDEVMAFINDKSKWIIKNIEKKSERFKTSKIVIGDNIYYLGKKYPFIVLNGRNDLHIYDDEIVVYCKDGSIDNAINVFYKETKKELLKMVQEIEPKYLAILNDYGYHLKPEYKVKILSSMWGVNYTKKNTITLNGKLIHFEPKCLEAVLWHELLHFVIPNHSKRFHEVLAYHMKDYKEIMDSIY